MTEPQTDEEAPTPERMRRLLSRNDVPIVPKNSIAGRALVAVVAIMTFLASLTTGAVMLVRASANEWQADVAREITVQVRATQNGARRRPSTLLWRSTSWRNCDVS